MTEENQNLGVQSHGVSSFLTLFLGSCYLFLFHTLCLLGISTEVPISRSLFVYHSLCNPAVPLMLAANFILALTAY